MKTMELPSVFFLDSIKLTITFLRLICEYVIWYLYTEHSYTCAIRYLICYDYYLCRKNFWIYFHIKAIQYLSNEFWFKNFIQNYYPEAFLCENRLDLMFITFTILHSFRKIRSCSLILLLFVFIISIISISVALQSRNGK